MSSLRARVLLPAFTLAWRELVRFYRQRNRVFGALAQPIIFWVLFGAGLRSSFKPAGAGGQDYLAYFFPGTLVLILLFTSIFSTISIIEDRKEGFLQSVVVSPVSRVGIVLGKIVGSTLLSVAQGLFFLLLSRFAGLSLDLWRVAAVTGVLGLLSFALAGLGYLIAWRMDSTQGFHAVMTVFLMPLWLLSGAFFPAAGAPVWLRWVMQLNPLTYGVALLRRVLDGGVAVDPSLPSLATALGLSVAFGLATLFGTFWSAQRAWERGSA